MNAQPLVSVVIPARNAEATLRRTLDCLVGQAERRWEAVVVNDGSTDRTAEIIAEYSARDPRFSTLPGPREGVSPARNLGIRAARGRWLLFLDADDWIDPRYMKKMLAALAASPGARVAYCAYQRVMPDGRMLDPTFDPRLAQTPFEILAHTAAACIHAVLMDRQMVVDLGGFDTHLKTCEDWDLWQRTARIGARWVAVETPLAFYHTTEGSLSRNRRQMLADAEVVIRRGFSADPRVANPLPAYAHGLTDDGQMLKERLGWIALWLLVLESIATGSTDFDLAYLDGLPAGREYHRTMAALMVDCTAIGTRLAPAELAVHWDRYGPVLAALIDRIAELWGDPHLGRALLYHVEDLILARSDLAAPRPLQLTLGLRVDFDHLEEIQLPKGIDRVYARLVKGDKVLGDVQLGALGTVMPQQWVRVAEPVMEPRAYLKQLGKTPSAWPWFAYQIAQRTAGRARRGERVLPRRNDIRELILLARRRPAAPVAIENPPAESHDAQLLRIEAEARATFAVPAADATGVMAGNGAPAARAAVVADGAADERTVIPVLMYHGVTDEGPQALAPYRVSPAKFDAQMNWLRSNGYTAIGSTELARHYAGNTPFAGRLVVITFDDGLQSFADNGWDILKRHGLTAEMFVVTGRVGGTADWDARYGPAAALMDAPTLSRLAREGLRIGSHLENHRAVDTLSTRELAEELVRSRIALEKLLGTAPRAFAAPYTVVDARLPHLAAECGYDIGFGRGSGPAWLYGDPLNLPRIEVEGGWSLDRFAEVMNGVRQ